MIKLYENIKSLRKENKWSQEELAKRMGYTDRSMIAKIESGAVDLAESKIMAFAKIFGVKPCELMGWGSPAAPSGSAPAAMPSPAGLSLSAVEEEIILKFRAADEFDQETVLRTLRIKREESYHSLGGVG